MADDKKTTTRKPKTVKQNDSLKDVDFKDLEEFKVNAPSLTEDGKSLVVTSNFEVLADKIKSVVAKYKNTQLTEDNVNYVKSLKTQFVGLRTAIERERKDWTKIYLNPAKDVMTGMCDDLQKIVAEGEQALTEQLDAYDQKRKDALKAILEEYRQDAIKEYGLREEYADLLVIKDKYFNKTQAEEDSADDIVAQAKELQKKQNDFDSAVALINTECEGSTLVPSVYIEQLKYKSAMELILQIKGDKKIAQQIYEEVKAKEEKGEPIPLGKSQTETDAFVEKTSVPKKAETRTRHLIVTYTTEQAELMADFFKKNNIQFKFVRS